MVLKNPNAVVRSKYRTEGYFQYSMELTPVYSEPKLYEYNKKHRNVLASNNLVGDPYYGILARKMRILQNYVGNVFQFTLRFPAVLFTVKNITAICKSTYGFNM